MNLRGKWGQYTQHRRPDLDPLDADANVWSATIVLEREDLLVGRIQPIGPKRNVEPFVVVDGQA